MVRESACRARSSRRGAESDETGAGARTSVAHHQLTFRVRPLLRASIRSSYRSFEEDPCARPDLLCRATLSRTLLLSEKPTLGCVRRVSKSDIGIGRLADPQ